MKCVATRRGLLLFSVARVVAELRLKFKIDTVEPCRDCGSRKTITLDGSKGTQ